MEPAYEDVRLRLRRIASTTPARRRCFIKELGSLMLVVFTSIHPVQQESPVRVTGAIQFPWPLEAAADGQSRLACGHLRASWRSPCERTTTEPLMRTECAEVVSDFLVNLLRTRNG